jgi:hypothetical protein
MSTARSSHPVKPAAGLVKNRVEADASVGWALARQEGPTVTKIMAPNISVSTVYEKCTSPVNLGYVALLQGTWHEDHVDHPQAPPLRCICNDDVSSLMVKINSLPSSFVLYVRPQGSSFTSTATIAANTVLFTLPVNVRDVECWTIFVDDPKQPASAHQIWVRLSRHTPP